jgi:hypothetical protein
MSSQILPPPEGPEYTPCACSHIEPEHDINGRWCAIDGCECSLYRPTSVSSAVRVPATDRAAVLLEAANALAALGLVDSLVSGPKAWTEAIETLRRMADGCPQCGDAGACNGGPCPLTADPAAVVSGRAADETQAEPTELPPVCEGFQWIGQSFATCDRCGQPAWDHAGEDVAAEGAGPFDNRRTVRPWKPGEADAIRAKWARPAADVPGAGDPQQPKQIRCDIAVSTRQPHPAHDWTQRPDGPTRHCPGANLQQPTEADRTVAYRLPAGRDLHCLACAPTSPGNIWTPVTAEELEDGGLCVGCGVDVLVEQQPKEDDAATAGDQARPECAHCWREIENRSTPNMGGPSRDKWVHVPGGFEPCFPQRGGDSPRAEPRVRP